MERSFMSLGVIGIDHIQIAVPRAREAECLVFYRAFLGLAEIAKPAELRARGGAWFQLAGTQLHIGLDAEASPPSRRHICFLVEDVARARARAESQGVPVEEESEVDGLRRFFIRDPAGNRIEIAQR
jgi:catechol 2,3-dioxygenase-like lactoylglutathione lyase family enzyme